MNSHLRMIGLFAAVSAATAQGPISFAFFQSIPLGTPNYAGMSAITPSSFATGDFNGDGLVDIVFSSPRDTVLLINHSNGAFESKGLGISAVSVVLVADMNGDKKLDLVIIGPNQPLLLLGNGDGTFQPPMPLPIAPLLLADFNGDKKVDLLGFCPTFTSGGFRAVYPGKGDGTFGPPLECATGAHEGDFTTRTIVTADLNGDGKLDFVWASIRSSGSIYAWLGNGDGTFQPAIRMVEDTKSGTTPFAIGDFNKDGKPDLAVGGSGGIIVLLGNGDGTFKTWPLESPVSDHFYEYFDGVTSPYRPRFWPQNNISVDDFDGDGNQDILLDNVILRGNGDGTFKAPQYISSGFPEAISVAFVDLDGDGKRDIVFLPYSTTVATKSTTLNILRNTSPTRS